MARKRKPASAVPRSVHYLAIAVISIVTALAFGFPVDPANLGKLSLFQDSVVDKHDSSRESALIAKPLQLPDHSALPISPKTVSESLPSQATAETLPAPLPSPVTPAPASNGATLTTSAPETGLAHAQNQLASVKASVSSVTSPALLLPADAQRALDINTVLPEYVKRDGDWLVTTVQAGDTLSGIFGRLSLKPDDMYALMLSSDDAKRLERLRPGQTFKVRADTEGRLMELVYQSTRIKGLNAKRKNDTDTFAVNPFEYALATRQAFAVGEVSHSLYAAAQKVGLPEKTIAQFGDILGWKIDFSHDVAEGDSFVVIYEEKHLDGELHGAGDVLALEFVNRGKSLRAVGIRDDKNRMHYFTPEGRSLKQAFMRNPVDFTRISSHFQTSRWHPVKGVRRPHKGVDYAAPTGTPIKASGDGRVSFIGRKGGYGKTVMVDHGRGYTTLYAHMSRFKKKLKVGSVVTQGDIIGYVGATGLATGPHLHYEFRINGKHQNPVTVKLPGQPIAPGLKEKFKQQSAQLIAQLDRYRQTQLAASQ